jgi:ribonuclease P protein subunit POP4
VKYTSAEPFTPKFVKDRLTTKSSRAQALYNERVRRRQLGLARRTQSRGADTKKKKEKKGVVVAREKMGRREAAEMGMWRLRKEEARYVPEPFF